jgi:hypothetical protein
MALFEVTIYNKEVREKVEVGEHHSRFNDSWADFQYIPIRGNNEDQARARIEEMHPNNQGFVIDDISMLEGMELTGKERSDERRQENQNIADADDRRSANDRRDTLFGVNLSTTSSLVDLGDLLDKECTDNWKIIFLSMDKEFHLKEVQIMFACKSDKENFIANNFKLKNS